MKKILLITIIIFITGCSLKKIFGPAEEKGPYREPPGSEYLSNYKTMQLVGSFQGWNLDDPETFMELVDDWTWEKTRYFDPGEIGFKFVPDGHWDPAFGTTGPDSGLSGPVELVYGLGTEITVYIPQAGYWKFTLNENEMYYRIELSEIAPGGVTGTVVFSDDTIPPYPEATLTLYSSNWDSTIASSSSDTMTGEFLIEGIPEGIYNLIAYAPGYLPDSVSNINVGTSIVDVGELYLLKSAGPSIVLDGVINEEEGWVLLDTSVINDFDGANLKALYGAVDNLYLYLAIETQHNQSWNLAYGFSIDVRDGGFTDEDSVDAWTRKIGFEDSLAPEFEVYFYWNGSTVDAVNLCEWTGSGWNYITPSSADYAFSGNSNSGLQVIEFRVPLSDLGNIEHYHVKSWIAGGDINSSAVDGIPDDPSLHDNPPDNEWTDRDVFQTFSILQ